MLQTITKRSSIASRSLGTLNMVGFACAGLSVLLSLSRCTLLQSPCFSDHQPYALLRQDEDYHDILYNPTCLHDELGSTQVRATQERTRIGISPLARKRDFENGTRASVEASWGSRHSRLITAIFCSALSTYADIHAAPRLRFFVQLTSAIEAGRSGGPETGDR